MFNWIRNLIVARNMAKLSRLIELARQADDVLLECKLTPKTRELLQQKRNELEAEIRVLMAA